MRILSILFFLTSVGTATANALDTSLLETQVRNTAKGNVGVGVQVVETGEQWFFKGDERFPMQSTYKAPIAVAVLHQVDEGTLTLDHLIAIHRTDLSVLWKPINQKHAGESRPFTGADLLRPMGGESENIVADVL